MAKEKLNFEDEQVRNTYRHTASHIMAQAVKNLWPDTKLAIGPAIDNGFYYDFESEHKFSEEDFLKNPEGNEKNSTGKLSARKI